jgi:hypothetical protein
MNWHSGGWVDVLLLAAVAATLIFGIVVVFR